MLARWARSYSLRAAALNVVLGERMRETVARLEPRCARRIVVIHNWADGTALRPQAGVSPLRARWGLEGRFVVAYSGNMGRAHEFDTVLDACERLRGEADIAFLFIGDGYHRPRLEREARRRGLENVTFQPYQVRGQLGVSLGVADVHLVSLQPMLEGLVVPSKFYGILAAGRPAIVIGDLDGEIARITRAARCGLAVAAGDAEGLAGAIRSLRGDAASCASLGANARAIFEARYDRPHAMALWEKALERAVR
jgi:glycosyltransferase involved in cell wall biosynthesis